MATDVTEYEKLGEDRLSFLDVVAQTVGFMGPVFGAILLLSLVVGANNAGKGAGVATPIAILIAAVGVAALGWIIAEYAKRIHAAGALYDYITAGAGERTGFVFGWVYTGGLIILAVAIPLLIGGVTADFLSSSYKIHIPYWILDLVYTGILFCVLYFGVRISTRVQLALVFFSASVVTIFLIYIIVKGGHGGNSIKPFSPGEAGGFGNLFYGVLYAVLLFVGFESAANLSEETREPKRTVPRAVLVAIGVVTVYFLVASYAEAIGFGLKAGAWAKSGAPVLVLALPSSQGGFGSSFLFDVMNILLILDIAAVGIGASVAATRLIFALGRDRRIPGAFARVSPRYGTPVTAIVAVCLIAVAEILWVRLSHGVFDTGGGPEYLPFFFWEAGYGGLTLAIVYAAVAVTAMRGLWGKVNPAPLVITAVVGLAVQAGAIWASIYKVPSPFNSVPWYLLGWALIGVVILVVLVARGRFRLSAQAAGAIPSGDVPAAVPSPGV